MPTTAALAASTVILRGQAKPEVLESWIRSEVSSLDPVVPANIQTFDQHMGELAARPRVPGPPAGPLRRHRSHPFRLGPSTA
ncbi:MAG: hypothetical protein QM757_23175 [Paludibaculum sp.]